MRILICFLAAALAGSTHATAQTVSVGDVRFDFANETLRPKSDLQKQFVASYLAAVAAKSHDALAALVHPASRACSDSEIGREYSRQTHQRDLNRDIPANARLIMQPFTDSMTFPYSPTGFANLPLRPTTVFGIDYNWEQRDAKGTVVKHIGVTVLRLLAEHDGQLRLIDYCLTPKGEEMFRQKQAATVPSQVPQAPKQ